MLHIGQFLSLRLCTMIALETPSPQDAKPEFAMPALSEMLICCHRAVFQEGTQRQKAEVQGSPQC